MEKINLLISLNMLRNKGLDVPEIESCCFLTQNICKCGKSLEDYKILYDDILTKYREQERQKQEQYISTNIDTIRMMAQAFYILGMETDPDFENRLQLTEDQKKFLQL